MEMPNEQRLPNSYGHDVEIYRNLPQKYVIRKSRLAVVRFLFSDTLVGSFPEHEGLYGRFKRCLGNVGKNSSHKLKASTIQ